MIKRHIIETIEEYDKQGVLTEKRIIETNEEDDSPPLAIRHVSEPILRPSDQYDCNVVLKMTDVTGLSKTLIG